MISTHASTSWSERQEREALREAGRQLGLAPSELPGLDGYEYAKFGFCGYLILVDMSALPQWCKLALVVRMDTIRPPKPQAINNALRYVSEAFGAPIMVEAATASRKRLYRRYGAVAGEGNTMYWRF